ncbi:MAG TPA: ATP-binding protein [Burkholderiales bacterium]|nr:ATP-binding protein [Burkholderiales bacterium]
MPTDISPLTVLWSMCASACLMMALMHVLLFARDRHRLVYGLAALMAFSAAVNAVCELFLMFAEDIPAYVGVLKVQVFSTFLIVVSLVWFIYVYYGTASRTLALAITAMWVMAIMLGIVLPSDGYVFSSISELVINQTYWGETFVLAQGERNSWIVLSDLASVLVLFYILQASFRARRIGKRRRAAMVGGASALFILLAGIHTPLVDAGIVRTPYLISFSFLAIVAAMTYELVSEAFLASRYARQISAGERRWQMLVDTVPVFVAGLDRDGRINYVNRFLREASGRGEGELLGSQFTDFLPGDQRVRAADMIRDVLDGALSLQARIPFLTKDGTRLEVVWSSGAVTGEDGVHTGILSVGADVTERVKALTELQETRRELDRLTRVTLLGEVAAGLAHELGQPLTAILSNAQAARRMLLSGSADLEEIRSIVEDIVADDKRASAVVSGLRAFLRKEEAVRKPVDINHVIHSVVDMLTSEIQAHRISLTLELDDDVPQIDANEVQLQQVVMNLLLNAIKVVAPTSDDRRKILVRSRIHARELIVSVSDKGPGIAAALLPKLFDPLVTAGYGGLGMGLAICRRIVELHGGKIVAENDPSGGAIFRVSLPLRDGSSVEAQK